jgi:predicted cupin superfamily sugar epimerase
MPYWSAPSFFASTESYVLDGWFVCAFVKHIEQQKQMASKFFTFFILITFGLNSLCVNIQNADYWISHLKMIPHPEGGYYKEVFRSRIEILKKGSSDKKQALTSIYYLLQDADYSGFHRIASDEIWYYHQGEPLFIYELTATGLLITHELSDHETGDLSVAIEAGSWFAAGIPSEEGFSLVSCAVAPAFDFKEFEMANKDELKQLFPQHASIVERFYRLTS